MTYGELIWSVSIDNEDYFIYNPATQAFVEFLKSKGIDVVEDKEVDFTNLRRQIFVFGKEVLRKKLREEHPDALGISWVFGEAHYVRETPVAKVIEPGFFSKYFGWISSTLLRK